MRFIAIPSLMLIVLLCVLAAPAHAQITITRADFPFQTGSGPFSSMSAENEDGSDTAAIEALIAARGANQVWDLTPLTFDFTYSGTFTVTNGATGPGAEISPLDQATLTSAVPFNEEEDGMVMEGVFYGYERLTDEAAYNLGGYFEGTVDGDPFEFSLTNTPDAEQHYVFPLTFGTTWTSEFTQGGLFESQVEQDYEVDGWGTMIVPDIAAPIPVLRVKITETITTFGFPSTSVRYELRSDEPIIATFYEGDDFGMPPTADVSMIGFSVSAEDAAPPTALQLDPVYPNPVARVARVAYALPAAADVELTVFDVLGRPVRTVAQGTRPAGSHTAEVAVDGLTSGRYVLRLMSGGAVRTRAFSVVR